MASPLRLRLLAEVLGTFLFFFLGFNAIAVSKDIGGGAISTIGIAFAFGLGLALAITALGHISGGHFNPAVTLGLATALKFPVQEVIPYWIAQLAGGIVACLVRLRRLFRKRRRRARHRARRRDLERRRAPARGDRDGPVRDRDLHRRDGRPCAVEGRHGTAADRALHLHGGRRVGPASGGSFNPARSLDPAIYNWDFSKVWIYLVGPIVGGMIGGAIWILFGPTRAQEPATIRTTGGVPPSS